MSCTTVFVWGRPEERISPCGARRRERPVRVHNDSTPPRYPEPQLLRVRFSTVSAHEAAAAKGPLRSVAPDASRLQLSILLQGTRMPHLVKNLDELANHTPDRHRMAVPAPRARAYVGCGGRGAAAALVSGVPPSTVCRIRANKSCAAAVTSSVSGGGGISYLPEDRASS